MRGKLKDKKAAKKIIKRAKEHPDWYTKEDVKFAKMVKRRIKLEKLKAKEDCDSWRQSKDIIKFIDNLHN